MQEACDIFCSDCSYLCGCWTARKDAVASIHQLPQLSSWDDSCVVIPVDYQVQDLLQQKLVWCMTHAAIGISYYSTHDNVCAFWLMMS